MAQYHFQTTDPKLSSAQCWTEISCKIILIRSATLAEGRVKTKHHNERIVNSLCPVPPSKDDSKAGFRPHVNMTWLPMVSQVGHIWKWRECSHKLTGNDTMLQLNKIEAGFVNESLAIKLNDYTGFTLSFLLAVLFCFGCFGLDYAYWILTRALYTVTHTLSLRLPQIFKVILKITFSYSKGQLI